MKGAFGGFILVLSLLQFVYSCSKDNAVPEPSARIQYTLTVTASEGGSVSPENTTTFYSSQDNLGKPIDHINWTYIGGYEIYDVNGYEDLKILILNYDNGDIEEFELSVINDQRIELYNIVSETTYEFSGRGFIQYLKGGKSKKEAENLKENNGRKRTKIKRRVKNRRSLK